VRDLLRFFAYRARKWLLGLGRTGLRSQPRQNAERAAGRREGPGRWDDSHLATQPAEGEQGRFRRLEGTVVRGAGVHGEKQSEALPEGLDWSETREAGRLVRKLVTTISRRRKRGRKRRTIDVRTTIHRNVFHGGTLPRLYWQAGKPSSPRVVLLLDTSTSMTPSARMMLQFLYALQAELTRLEVFIFGERLNYATPCLQADFPSTLACIARLPQWNFSGTELWRPLAQLRNEFGHLITSRTVVILLTDCMFYEKFFALAPLEALRRKVKRLYLFNPDPRARDPRDHYYQETLAAFSGVVDHMFLTSSIREVASALREVVA
jgi:uncharacterized protein with von Willebrand factor type A (vWA) domain